MWNGMRRATINVFLLLTLGVFMYVYRVPILAQWEQLYTHYFPCIQPITYRIGELDTRFGISPDQFLRVITKAETLWEKAAAKELFTYTPTGKLNINLIFDDRQRATDRMRELGLSVDASQSSYDTLTERYKVLTRQFENQKSSYEVLVTGIERRQSAYNAEVARWNRKGGAPKEVYERLDEEGGLLKHDVARVRSLEVELKKLQGDVNSLVTVINQIANNINVKAEEFNAIGKVRGEEFTEGTYTSDGLGQRIDIYQFNDTEMLVRVLAHEFGHALALEHVEDPEAIMYRLNRGANSVLTPSDIRALKEQCGSK